MDLLTEKSSSVKSYGVARGGVTIKQVPLNHALESWRSYTLPFQESLLPIVLPMNLFRGSKEQAVVPKQKAIFRHIIVSVKGAEVPKVSRVACIGKQGNEVESVRLAFEIHVEGLRIFHAALHPD